MGGQWICLKCKRATGRKQAAKIAEKRNRIPRAGSRNAFYMGYKQLTRLAAEKIWRFGLDAESILKYYSPKIASAKRRTEGKYTGRLLPQETLAARAGIIAEVGLMAKDESKKPWRYLQIKPGALGAWDEFDLSLAEANDSGIDVPPCQDNPAPYMDYDEENPPTAVGAETLCSDCPLRIFQNCDRFAELERPAIGVWAGKRWLYGEIVND